MKMHRNAHEAGFAAALNRPKKVLTACAVSLVLACSSSVTGLDPGQEKLRIEDGDPRNVPEFVLAREADEEVPSSATGSEMPAHEKPRW